MTNSWSFLYDELKMDEYPYPDNFGVSPDYTELPDDYLQSMYPEVSDETQQPIVNTIDLKMTSPNQNRYKYSEERILKELSDYISTTYNQHYSAGDDKIQTLDLIEACGDGEAFCRSNILKYASRYDKKGTARRDIMKILHYAVLLMHFNDKNALREDYPNR